MMSSNDELCIVLAGTGKLSLAMAQSLAMMPQSDRRLRLVVLGRDEAHAQWIAASAMASAVTAGHTIDAVARAVDWREASSIATHIKTHQPDLVLQFATEQPPSSLKGDDRWSRLVAKTSFAVTLPFQLAPLQQTAKALMLAGSSAPIINACLPDLVNVIGTANGWPILSGLGNLATMTTLIQGERPEWRQARFLGCHHQLSLFLKGAFTSQNVLRGFIEDREIASDELLACLNALPHSGDMSTLTVATAVPLIRAFLGIDQSWRGQIPAPLGLPGGYPVHVTKGRLALDLQGISREEAIDWNERMEALDGVLIRDGRIQFVGPAKAEFEQQAPGFALSWDINDVDGFIAQARIMRAELSR